MKFSGEVTISTAPAELYARLTDPKGLASRTPGFERYETQPDGRLRVLGRLGPAGYEALLRQEVLAPGRHVRVDVEGRSGLLRGDGRLELELEPAGSGTLVRYAVELDVKGPGAFLARRALRPLPPERVRELLEPGPRS